MKVSAKTDYACRALLELSLHWPNPSPLRINAIAERQKIPIKFLTHILINLKQLGYVQSIRGNKGGYILEKSPQDIKLGQIVVQLSEARIQKPVVVKKNDLMDTIWQQVDQNVIQMMDNIDFEDLSRRFRNMEKVPMYTI